MGSSPTAPERRSESPIKSAPIRRHVGVPAGPQGRPASPGLRHHGHMDRLTPEQSCGSQISVTGSRSPVSPNTKGSKDVFKLCSMSSGTHGNIHDVSFSNHCRHADVPASPERSEANLSEFYALYPPPPLAQYEDHRAIGWLSHRRLNLPVRDRRRRASPTDLWCGSLLNADTSSARNTGKSGIDNGTHDCLSWQRRCISRRAGRLVHDHVGVEPSNFQHIRTLRSEHNRTRRNLRSACIT
jgi:hypothetical protein